MFLDLLLSVSSSEQLSVSEFFLQPFDFFIDVAELRVAFFRAACEEHDTASDL